MHQWKDLLMDFVTGLLISTNCKKDSYYSILVIVDWLTKMVYYKLIMITIDAPGLAKFIIYMVVLHHGLSDSIVFNESFSFKVLVIALLFSHDKIQTIHRILPLN